ncbi:MULTISPECIES: phage holin family protein [unclassified Gemella]|uniref:phage holin family protein n=1 Tax=unclassified Gemella TaxID=2624949 RepID=UPI0015D031D3|nr:MULTISPECIES: phage holin family protein [unclassified Gemella]MBF0710586.1 phage holin family protein [Gemella sp. GL1.1]NYS27930.1 phage holin family protein [Gemella sp. GL1]
MNKNSDYGIWNLMKGILINFIIIVAFAGFFKQSLVVANMYYAFSGAVLITLFYKFIRPLFLLISIVPILLTFGLFIVIINAGIILLVSYLLSPQFEISSFWSALGLAIFISIFNAFLNRDNRIVIKRF